VKPRRSIFFLCASFVVRGLCRWHSARFRSLHASEIHSLFAERYAEERSRGFAPLAVFLGRTFADLLAGIIVTRSSRAVPPPLATDSYSSRSGDSMLSQFMQDARFAVRGFGKNPGFALLAILTLALGIGATTSIFSVLYGVVLRPLPYPEPGRLVTLHQSSRENPVMSVAFPNFVDWRARSTSFEEMGAALPWNMTLTGQGDAERLLAARVTAGFFGAFRMPALLGRTFGPEEDRDGAAGVVLLSEQFWERRFARDPQILGRSLTLSGTPYTVIGVMPAAFYSPRFDIFVSLGQWEKGLSNRSEYPGISVRGRLKVGVTLQQARAEMAQIAQTLGEQYEEARGQSAVVFPLLEKTVEDVRAALWILLGAVGFVLLIACANVANLLLARSAARQREIAVRRALGAGQARLVRQLMTEGLLLSLLAGAAGIVIAFWATDLIIALGPRLPRLAEVRVDGLVLTFAIAVTLATNLFFGLAPAWLISRVDLAQAMREGARNLSRSHSGLRHGLLVAEVAVALVLVVGAGLTLQSFLRVQQADTGVHPRNVLTAQISLTSDRYATQDARRQFFAGALERLGNLPGVQSAGVVQPVPLSGETWFRSFVIQGEPFPAMGMAQTADNFHVSPGYFGAMGIPLLQGRYFTTQDRRGAEEVCIVDEEFARKHFPRGAAVGRRLAWGFNFRSSEPPKKWATIVGVVGHVKQKGADQESRLQIYNPFDQAALGMAAFTLQTQGDPAALVPQLRQTIRELDPNLALYQVQPMAEMAAKLHSDRRVTTLLLNVFAGLALALACIGIYGVMSYTVAQRTQEIGIRVALGAQPGDVYQLVLGNGARLVLTGLVLGLAASLAMSCVLQGMLFGITGHDPVTYGAVALLLCAAALLACWLPARRATRMSPLIALRSE